MTPINNFPYPPIMSSVDFGWFRPSKGDQEIVRFELPYRKLVVFKTPEGNIKLGDD